MSIQLADRSVKYPRGIIEDVLVKVDKFIFPVDFVVLDMDEDVEVPLILGRPFVATARAVIDVGDCKLVLRVGDEEMIFKIYDAMRFFREQDDSCYFIDSIDHITQDSFQEIVQEEMTKQCPAQDEEIGEEPDNHPSRQVEYKGIKINDELKQKPSIEEPPKLELKQLPNHLEYAFLGNNSTLPVIIASNLQPKEKDELIQVLKEHKKAIVWKISDIKGISPSFCTYKILMEDEYKPCVQAQRRLNPNMKEVVKDENELIPTRTVTGWRVCIDYRKLNDTTRKDHFPLPFIDQMLERLSGHMYYCFLDGLSGYFQIPIAPEDQEKTTFTCPYVGAVLGQRRDKHFQPIYYASETLTATQENYTTTKKELLAVVFAFDKFRSYLILSKVVVYTDHSALRYLLTKTNAKPRLIQ
ncbi:hypothetical protein PVK06_048695 [Gossypium arboreum]|uniref:RNA-directed DNA polymerase n=1 Tax=Gossypium arboreum TaxID=29729 RepID=A0ABR0MGJ7_GOSAR|nr:hypothetical protein PVK06_048695 [Gossypium arboreum]